MSVFGSIQDSFEEWRDVIGFEGYYKVSSRGRVLSCVRTVKCGNGTRKVGGKLRTLSTESKYAMVELIKDDQRKMCMVHRLVAEAFIPNPENKETVNHIDGNKLNNCVENLEWATQQENNQHALRTGLTPTKQVRCKETGVVYPYGAVAEKELSLPSGSVYRSLYESCKVFGKYTFEYVNESDYIKKPAVKLESRGKAVVCIETGTRYKDGRTAEKELGLYETAVYNSIYENRSVKGFTFRFEDDSSYIHCPKSRVPNKPGQRIKVKCLETGDIFSSCAQAAKANNVSESSVSNSLKQNRSVKGLTFVQV